MNVELSRVSSYGAPRTRDGIVQPMLMRAWAATRQLLAEFVAIFEALFQRGANTEAPLVYPGTLADAVHTARVELARRHGLSEEELVKALRVEFETLELVLNHLLSGRGAVGD